MVLPSSTAAQSEAAEADWLTELRRWLTLGRKGVIVMIRDAQRARLRELVLMLDEIEPGFCFDTDATVIADAAPGSLVLLGLQREQLDWLNLNRPLFAERSLRVVLWAEGELAVALKFHAPDLHDWISHFVTCPVGVPEFAVEALAQSVGRSPGVAWTGPGLDLARARLPDLDNHIEMDPSQIYPQIIESLEDHKPSCIIWKNAHTSTHLWRVRLATAEVGFTGTNILDNPTTRTPEWRPINANQMNLRDAAAIISGDNRHRAAALAELNPGVLAPADTATEHGNIGQILSSVYSDIEYLLRSGIGNRTTAVFAISSLGQSDIAAYWETRWGIEGPTRTRGAGRVPIVWWPTLTVQAMTLARYRPADIVDFLNRIQNDAEQRFGLNDPEYQLVSRFLGLVAGVYAAPDLADRYLAGPAKAAERGRFPLLAGVELEHSVVQTMLGRYEAALAQFESARATDPDHESFERFHQLTRAALGQMRLGDADQSPLSSQIEARARALLRSRLERLAKP
jgi:hypothetical protein